MLPDPEDLRASSLPGWKLQQALDRFLATEYYELRRNLGSLAAEAEELMFSLEGARWPGPQVLLRAVWAAQGADGAVAAAPEPQLRLQGNGCGSSSAAATPGLRLQGYGCGSRAAAAASKLAAAPGLRPRFQSCGCAPELRMLFQSCGCRTSAAAAAPGLRLEGCGCHSRAAATRFWAPTAA